MTFKEFSESKKYKNFMAKVYGIGASIVLVGALFKLTHMSLFGWSGAANTMLTLGLLTEAIIFFFSAFEPAHLEPDWSLVYPELWDLYHGDGPVAQPKKPTAGAKRNEDGNVSSDAITEKLNEMFEKANINSATMERLSMGLTKLGENASKIADVSEAVAATSNYTKAMNKASETAMELDAQMSKTATNAAMFSDTSRKMNDTMALYIEKVNASSTENLNHQLNDLSKRMTAMNTVYGNMLNAMNIKA